ncbi:hypothetical protein BDV12DRAFT_210984 [Aspergillus spectabilis]
MHHLRPEIPVTVQTSIFDIPRVDNNIDAVDFIWDLQRWTAPNVTDRVTGVETMQDTFTINAQLCVPKNLKGSILHIATHGFGFDKTYWDSSIQPEKCSYVDAALAAGYSILTYDRLGVGKSSKPDGYKVVQAATQIEILKEITLLARSGSLLTSSAKNHNNINTPAFEKVVLVGHSLGSGLTIGVLSSYPEILDAVISPGLIPSGKFGLVGQVSFGLEHAESNDKRKFRGRGSGYLVQGSESSIKETGTVGEFLSLGGIFAQDVSAYGGPILFALGEYDFAICAGNCTGSYDQKALEKIFSGASDVSVHIQKGSGSFDDA